MVQIYKASLLAKFDSIMDVIARDLGYGECTMGLTAERWSYVRDLAEQAIIDWASWRQGGGYNCRPITNMQHLVDEYCAIAEHL